MVCCFIGHRKLENKETLLALLKRKVEDLIINEKATIFLFGSRSQFDSLFLHVVTKLKSIYPFLLRIYVRAEFQSIDKNYEKYLLKSYDRTYLPESVINSGKLVYIKRNQDMIDKSDICFFYYNENYQPPNKNKQHFISVHMKSGAKLALLYALQKKKAILYL